MELIHECQHNSGLTWIPNACDYRHAVVKFVHTVCICNVYVDVLTHLVDALFGQSGCRGWGLVHAC